MLFKIYHKNGGSKWIAGVQRWLLALVFVATGKVLGLMGVGDRMAGIPFSYSGGIYLGFMYQVLSHVLYGQVCVCGVG